MQTPLKILLVDDTPENIKFMERFLHQEGHDVCIAKTGAEAIQLFPEFNPDLVIMDVMMPGMNGYDCTRKIREIDIGKWVPVVFVSALDQPVDIMEGIEAGGDDYLTKPVDLHILRAKMLAMQRIAALQRKIEEDAVLLKKYYDKTEYEKELAREVHESIMKFDTISDPVLQFFNQPADHLSGDVIAATRNKDNKLFVMLADATGHGMSAAICQIPLTLMFYNTVKSGSTLQELAFEANKLLNKLLPADKFVAATLIMLDEENKYIEVWNGANPAVLLCDSDGVVNTFGSNHPPLGVRNPDSFSSETEIYKLDVPLDLVAFSDGALEVLDMENMYDSVKIVSEYLDASSPYSSYLSFLKSYTGEVPDDISIINISLHPE